MLNEPTTPKLPFLEVLKSQYCETAVEPMIFYEPGLFAFADLLSQTFIIGKMNFFTFQILTSVQNYRNMMLFCCRSFLYDLLVHVAFCEA